MAHPLSGSDLKTLAKVVARSGAPSDVMSGAAIALAALMRAPVSAVEYLWAGSNLPAAEEMPAPVFILGHWRSGTTHLYNVMCESGEWGFVPPVATGLPWDLFGIARVFKPLLDRALPAHRYIDNIPVTPISPQEDEIALANMTDLSFYHGIYFPAAFEDHLNRGLFFDGLSVSEQRAWRRTFKYFLRKLYVHQGRKPLLIKNPVYTSRIDVLLECFPDAKFIHIHRNPHDVFRSMRNFYQKLFAEFALQNYDHVDIDETILSVYARMMALHEKQTALIPDGRFVELSYQELDENPLAALETCYQALSLDGYEEAKPKFCSYLTSVATFEKNKFEPEKRDIDLVAGRLEYFFRKWDYQTGSV